MELGEAWPRVASVFVLRTLHYRLCELFSETQPEFTLVATSDELCTGVNAVLPAPAGNEQALVSDVSCKALQV